MDKTIMAIGILIVLEGILLLIKPVWMQKAIRFFAKGKTLYLAALLRLVLGIIFLVSATSCTHYWVIIGFGILLLLAGAVMFVIRLDKLKAYLNWWLQRSLITIRLLSIIAFIIGGVIIWAA